MILLSSDLNNGTISKLTSALEKDIEDCTSLNGALDSFIASIGKKESLSGASYDAIKAKLESYKTIVTQRQKAAKELITAINSAVQKMKTYIDGYTKLDDSELETTRQNYKNAITEIANIKNTMDEVLTTEQKSRISYLEQEARTLNKLIDKLENLAPTDASAYSTITGAEASVNSLSSNVNGMTPIQVNTSISV